MKHDDFEDNGFPSGSVVVITQDAHAGDVFVSQLHDGNVFISLICHFEHRFLIILLGTVLLATNEIPDIVDHILVDFRQFCGNS